MSAPFLILVAIFLALTLARVPIAFAMLVAALAYLFAAGRDLGLAADQIMNTLANNYLLVAIPLFMLAANLMNAGSISDRLFAACHVFVGRIRGGLAQVDVLVSVLFASMSGSAVADAAGPGLVTIRAMDKAGYPRGFAAAIVAASSVLGPIIPPSIPMILYALMANASIAALFLGGVLPGLLIAGAMMAVVWITARRRDFPIEPPIPRAERPRVLARALMPLGMPVVLLGGIYSGAFTPTEAAAVAALYALLLAGVVYRELGWPQVFGAFADTARQTAVILLMICGAFAVNYAVTAEQLDKALAAWIAGLGLSPLAFLVTVNLVFLVLGCLI
ncbi:MAG TPA: TRAP transporter large permease, partial [Burkholderiales bacterium]